MCFLLWIHSITIFHFNTRRFTYLIKAETLSINFLRFSGVAAMSEYFPDSSDGPPMAIETFNFGFFSFKLTTFLYWPALCTKILFQPKFIVHYWMKFLCIFKIFFFYYLCHHFLLYQGMCLDFVLNAWNYQGQQICRWCACTALGRYSQQEIRRYQVCAMPILLPGKRQLCCASWHLQ